MSRLVNTKLCIPILICAVIAIAASAALAIDLPYNTTYLGGSGRSASVSANVTWITDPGVYYHYYQYQYFFTFNASTAGKYLKNFSVSNNRRLPWIDGYTSQPTIFTTPMSYDPAQTSVSWVSPTSGVLSSTGLTVEFGYYSLYGGYEDTTSAGSGSAWSVSGHTLGMVPEPGSLTALALGLTGLASFVTRGRRRRR